MPEKLFTNLHVKAIEDDGDPNGTFEAILSAPVEDRDSEVIDGNAFLPLPKSIPILADHDAQLAKVVARAEPFYDGDVLKARGRFGSHPLAQYVRGLLIDGIIDTMSVGFMNATRKMTNGAKHITKGELLEASFVVIPSNRDALVTAVKAFHATGADRDDDEKAYMDVTAEGSYEEVIRSVRRSLNEASGEYAYVEVLATFSDRVVYNLRDFQDGTEVTLQVDYAIESDGITLSEPKEVDVTAVISPKALAAAVLDGKAGRRNSSKDQEAIQKAHDMLASAGAECKAENGEAADKGFENFSGDGIKAMADALAVELDLNEAEAGWTEPRV